MTNRYCEICGCLLSRDQKYTCSKKHRVERMRKQNGDDDTEYKSVASPMVAITSDAPNRCDVNRPFRSIVAGKVQWGNGWMFEGPGAVSRTTVVSK